MCLEAHQLSYHTEMIKEVLPVFSGISIGASRAIANTVSVVSHPNA